MSMPPIKQKPLITTAELKLLLNDAPEQKLRIKILDATFVLPSSSENPRQNYNRSRIPGALFFDIEAIADHASPLAHTVPTQEQFETGLSALGITPEDFVILYGQQGMTMGPCRVWWTFRLFGHDNIAVLDGGLPEWIRNGGQIETGPPPSPAPSRYKASSLRSELLVTQNQVRKASEENLCPILDARPKDRFLGTAPEPRPGMCSGHIPGSLSLPASAFVDPQRGTLKNNTELQALFESNDLNLGTKDSYAITTCGSGITACVITFALFRLGFDKIAVYDGSWAEWGQKNAGNKIACGI